MNGQKIRKIRKALGLTQEEFSKRLGVSFVTLNRWENHHTSPSALALQQLQILEAQSKRKPMDGVA